MKFFAWNNNVIADADLLVRIEDSEIKEVEAMFPEASELCSHWDGAYFALIDTKRKKLVPLTKLSFAFGGMYNSSSPYGEEVTAPDVNIWELTWEVKHPLRSYFK